MIELHHRLTANPHLLWGDFDALWDRRDIVQVGAVVLPTLSRSDLPLYLCVHGALHCWERLRWLVDVADLLRQPEDMLETLEAAEAEGLGAVVRQALLLAHHWLGLAVAPTPLTAIDNDPAVRRLEWLRARYFGGVAWHMAATAAQSRWMRLHKYALKRQGSYFVAELMSELDCRADWEAFRLPDSLFWLYRFLRPVGWLLRRLPACTLSDKRGMVKQSCEMRR